MSYQFCRLKVRMTLETVSEALLDPVLSDKTNVEAWRFKCL